MRTMPEMNWGTPRLISQEEADEALARQKLRTLVRLICDCPDPITCIEDPKATYHDILDLMPDLPQSMKRAAELVMLICKRLEIGRN